MNRDGALLADLVLYRHFAVANLYNRRLADARRNAPAQCCKQRWENVPLVDNAFLLIALRASVKRTGSSLRNTPFLGENVTRPTSCSWPFHASSPAPHGQ